MEEVKKKKKPKSLSAKFKKLQHNYKELYKQDWEKYRQIRRLEKIIERLELLTPVHIYKVEFKMKANSGGVFTYTEIQEGYTFRDAIEKIKKGKTHPDTFELVNLTVLV